MTDLRSNTQIYLSSEDRNAIIARSKVGNSTWEQLADLKEPNPMLELANYAIAQRIESEPAFTWWVPFTIKRRDRMLATLKTHKFGLAVPKTYEDYIRIDRENGNTLWQDAIRGASSLSGNEWRLRTSFLFSGDCHLVFDIKMEGLQRKARFAAGGHIMTESPRTYGTYASFLLDFWVL